MAEFIRLTGRNMFGEVTPHNKYTDYVAGDKEIRNRLAEYEDTGLSPEEVEKLKQQRDIYKKYWIQQLDAMLAEFDNDGWCRLVMKKDDVLQMKKEMENDYGIFK